MTNISSAYGTITFDKQFYFQHHTLINDAMQMLVATFDGNGINEVDNQGTSFTDSNANTPNVFAFAGHSCWLMESTLTAMLTKQWYQQHYGNVPSKLSKLASLIIQNLQVVKISFDAINNDCKILYHQCACAKADNGNLVYKINATINYDFNLPNLNALDILGASAIASATDVAEWLTDYGLDANKYPLTKVLQFIKNDKFLHGFVDDADDIAWQKVTDKFGNYEA